MLAQENHEYPQKQLHIGQTDYNIGRHNVLVNILPNILSFTPYCSGLSAGSIVLLSTIGRTQDVEEPKPSHQSWDSQELQNLEGSQINLEILQILDSHGFLCGAAEIFRFSKAFRYCCPMPGGVFDCSLLQRSSSSSITSEVVKVIADRPFHSSPLLVYSDLYQPYRTIR